MKFEVIDIKVLEPQCVAFQVEVELPDRSRRKFGYPLGEGWDIEYAGETKFITDIREKLKKEEIVKVLAHDSIKGVKSAHTGKKFNI